MRKMPVQKQYPKQNTHYRNSIVFFYHQKNRLYENAALTKIVFTFSLILHKQTLRESCPYKNSGCKFIAIANITFIFVWPLQKQTLRESRSYQNSISSFLDITKIDFTRKSPLQYCFLQNYSSLKCPQGMKSNQVEICHCL